jgi:Ca2+-binding RTX toxin-like protein
MSIELTRPMQVAAGDVLTTGIIGQSGALTAMGTGTIVLSVAGSIRTTDLWGVYLQGGQPSQIVVIEPTGSIVVSGNSLNLIGIQAGSSSAPSIRNYGSIQVIANATGVGMSLSGPSSGSFNAGSIMVTGTGQGVSISGPGASDFVNSGSVLAVGSSVSAVRFIAETAFLINTSTGSLRAFGSTASIGLHVSADYTAPGAGLRNYGLIEGTISVQLSGYNSATPNLELINANNAILRGKVLGSGGVDRITNIGLIEGEVVLGGGNDVYNGTGGRASGMVQGGDGLDTLMGGDLFDYLHGNQGDDSLSGASGDDWVVGGQGNDIMLGDAGVDLMLGNLGNDTMDGGIGNDTVRGGQGNDSINGGEGNDFVSGDRGDDTLAGGAGADIFHSFNDAGLDVVVDFNRNEGDVVNLLAGSTYTLEQVDADVLIRVTGGATMVLRNLALANLTGDWLTVG